VASLTAAMYLRYVLALNVAPVRVFAKGWCVKIEGIAA
jgi:hypothetical protein